MPNGGPIATLNRQRRGDDGYRVWVIEDADGHEVGSLVPANRINWRGNRKPVKATAPLSWTGSVRLTGSAREVAHIRTGTVFHPEGGRVADVLFGDKPWFGTQSMWGAWTLKFYDCTDLRLRVACFGWLALAWSLQRTLDTSDESCSTPRTATEPCRSLSTSSGTASRTPSPKRRRTRSTRSITFPLREVVGRLRPPARVRPKWLAPWASVERSKASICYTCPLGGYGPPSRPYLDVVRSVSHPQDHRARLALVVREGARLRVHLVMRSERRVESIGVRQRWRFSRSRPSRLGRTADCSATDGQGGSLPATRGTSGDAKPPSLRIQRSLVTVLPRIRVAELHHAERNLPGPAKQCCSGAAQRA